MDIKEFRKIVTEIPATVTDEEWWDIVSDNSLHVLRKRMEDRRAGLLK